LIAAILIALESSASKCEHIKQFHIFVCFLVNSGFSGMRLLAKNIPNILMWLAGAIFCAHMIIPHDHHLPDAFGKYDVCHQGKNQSAGHKHGLPLHCHALNDLAAEKATKYYIGERIILDNSIISDMNDFSSDPDDIILSIRIIPHSVIYNSDFHRLASLRAPPGKA
jgi:hypothetical protein